MKSKMIKNIIKRKGLTLLKEQKKTNKLKRKGLILFKEKMQMKNLMNILKIKDQIQIIENKKE